MKLLLVLFITCLFNKQVLTGEKVKDKLLVVSVATDETEGYQRFIHSLKYFKINHEIFGLDEEWRGGEMMTSLGGGQKVNILRNVLEKYKNDKNLIIMFTDSYDVIFNAGESEILNKFRSFNARMVFSAESTVWPDSSLKNDYPEVNVGKRFLCSGGIIGYAPEFYKTISQWKIGDNDDDQLYYTKIYLNAQTRTALNATLDHTSILVQNINFAKDELSLEVVGEITRVKNIKYNTYPVVIHGNGPSKIYLNYISNYAPDGWHPELGCRSCEQNLLNIDYEDVDNVPHVVLSIFIEETTPFLPEFFQRIENLDYPKSQITLFIHNNVNSYVKIIAKFLMENRILYKGTHVIQPSDGVDVETARNAAVTHSLAIKSDYVFMVDSLVQITEPATLKILIMKNKQVIAPLVSRHGQLWSNFWGALNLDGYYARSEDYLDIVNRVKLGVWNVPFISSIFLIKTYMLEKLVKKVPQPFTLTPFDSDMAFCANLRNQYVFMHVINENMFGRLTINEGSRTDELYPDLWEVSRNKIDWEEKYLHSDYYKNLEEGYVVEEPCPDAFVFPMMTDKLCDHLVETMESYNLWSSGKNEDPRISGGYENVPTIDVHMNQVGFEKEWLYIMKTYVSQMVTKVFTGFYPKADSTMLFIVRYRPDEQPLLRPHHDSSTWTLNVALNTKGVDFEGGGSRFIRQDCAVDKQKKGWGIIHPGRLTHYHEGLPTTNGTRYIFVSFMDP